MSEYDIELYNNSILTNKLSKDIVYKVKKGIGSYKLYEGVVNCGGDNERGNEGLISIIGSVVEASKSEQSIFENGTYIVYLSLTKASVEFKIPDCLENDYEPSKLLELSVKVNLPEYIKHPIYPDLNFNIVTGYKYNGKLIKNANKNLVDRGFEDAIYIFKIEGGNIIPCYHQIDTDEFFNA